MSPLTGLFLLQERKMSMEYEEYKDILNGALAKYVNDGGSVYFIGSATKEYFFEYEDGMSADKIDRLEDKAIQAMIAKKPLPQGIRLTGCVIHERR